jgi:hypothetical protein
MNIRSRIASRAYRVQESAAHRLPAGLHRVVCPFCRGMARHCAQQERQLRWSQAWLG